MTAPKTFVAQPMVGECFVAAYPPFDCWKPEHNPALTAALEQARPNVPLAVYVHIPFCQKKCDFCYYLSHAEQPAHLMSDYVETVIDEMEIYASHPGIAGRPVSSVYFGGGTPSLLSTEQARELLAGLKHALPWRGVKEVAFETTPTTVRATFIEALLDLGVTRLSLGAQSFDDALLARSGSAHRRADTLTAYSVLREAGCEQITLNLICGLPGETEESWSQTIDCVIDIAPECITIRQAEIRKESGSYRKLEALLDAAPLIPWETKRARAAEGFARLARAGYATMSAYTVAKDPKLHWTAYENHVWKGGDVLGLGLGAYGYLQGTHYQNEISLLAYSNAVHERRLPLKRSFPLSARDRAIREFVLQAKSGCVERQPLLEKHGLDVADEFAGAVKTLAKKGMLTVTKEAVRLTDRGLLSVDWLSPTFFDVQFKQA